MQDTFWTPELWCEFLNSNPGLPPTFQNEVNLFKSSKFPKKEWEIVAYIFKPLSGKISRPPVIGPDSKYWKEAQDDDGEDYGIHSVRRLSDGEIFSVGDRIEGRYAPISKIVIKDNITGSVGLECGHETSFTALQIAKKLPQPILTTVDGVEMRENEECWIVDKHYNLLPEPEKINEFKRNYFSNCFIFSTREAAEKYILENKPLLSLNDVKDVCSVPGMRVSAQTDILIEKLTALVKQKLNQ